MTTFTKADYDGLYTFMEELFPTLDNPEKKRTCEYFMDRCEHAIGQLRKPADRLNSGRFNVLPGDVK